MQYLMPNINELIDKERFLIKLKPLQRQFVEIFCTNCSITSTAKMLNIPLRKAYAMYHMPKIQDGIAAYRDILAYRNNITSDYFISQLKSIVANDNNKVSDKLSALALLAKITGFLSEKTEVNQPIVFQLKE